MSQITITKPVPKDKTMSLSVRIPEDLYDRIYQLARVNGVSVSEVTKQVLKYGVVAFQDKI